MRPKRLILVIEANETALSTLLLAISINGFRVIGVCDKDQALKALSENEIDAVFMRTPVACWFDVPVVVCDSISRAIVRLRIATWGAPRKNKSDANSRGKTSAGEKISAEAQAEVKKG